jgi:hypothetical protein
MRKIVQRNAALKRKVEPSSTYNLALVRPFNLYPSPYGAKRVAKLADHIN